MPVSLEVLRTILGVLCVLFAYMLGRETVHARREGRPRRVVSWTLRTALTGLAVAWRHGLDGITIATLAGAAVAAGVGVWMAMRPKVEEDLSREIFPPE